MTENLVQPEMAAAPVVYVVDDDASVRAAIEDLLASVGLHSCGFGSTSDFIAYWRQASPDQNGRPGCLVLDIRMPGQSGMEFRRQMLELELRLPTIFITGHGDIPMSVEAMKTGAIEFLTKPFRDQDLLDAIQLGINRDRVRRADEMAMQQQKSQWESLSGGEREVVRLVVAGKLNKQVAAELDVSEITVKVRRAQAMRKLNARSLPDLVRVLHKLDIQ